jgi:histidine triad (HIT) family protein
MDGCLFCKIINKQIKADIVYDDQEVLAFRDINPQAPHHILIIPKKHIARISDIGNNPEDQKLVGKLVAVANELARKAGVAEGGYRLVFNCNHNAGQTVFHIHLHMLGGRMLKWPPG